MASLTQVADGSFWQVVGGVNHGGIVTREARDTTSALQPERLTTGSIIKQLEVFEDDAGGFGRLHYELAVGVGPKTGWASLKLASGKDLLVRTSRVLSAKPRTGLRTDLPPPPLCKLPPASGRDLRILCLHGSASNSSILGFQMSRFKKALGKVVTWLVPDGTVLWEKTLKPPGGPANNWYDDRSEFELAVSKGKPFYSWLDLAEIEDGSGMDALPEPYDKAMEWFDDYLKKEHPIDVVVAFSIGSCIINRKSDEYRRQGIDVPWALNILFAPSYFGPINRTDDSALPFTGKPTWIVASPKSDEYNLQVEQYKERYANVTFLDHDDGHGFPSSEPRASEIYSQLASVVRDTCTGGA